MIFLDSNVPMYLVGEAHPNKTATIRVLEVVTQRRERLVTDVEVFQELLHRYTALHQVDAVDISSGALQGLVSETFPIEFPDVQAAKELVREGHRLSARDALHIAVMRRHGVDTIMTFDRGFDGVPGITRLA